MVHFILTCIVGSSLAEIMEYVDNSFLQIFISLNFLGTELHEGVLLAFTEFWYMAGKCLALTTSAYCCGLTGPCCYLGSLFSLGLAMHFSSIPLLVFSRLCAGYGEAGSVYFKLELLHQGETALDKIALCILTNAFSLFIGPLVSSVFMLQVHNTSLINVIKALSVFPVVLCILKLYRTNKTKISSSTMLWQTQSYANYQYFAISILVATLVQNNIWLTGIKDDHMILCYDWGEAIFYLFSYFSLIIPRWTYNIVVPLCALLTSSPATCTALLLFLFGVSCAQAELAFVETCIMQTEVDSVAMAELIRSGSVLIAQAIFIFYTSIT